MPPRAKILFMGEAGSSKTTLLANSLDDPRMFPRLHVDCESGSLAIQSKIREVNFDMLDKFAGWNERTQAYDLAQAYEEIPNTVDVLPANYSDFQDIIDLMKTKRLPYKVLCIDTLSDTNFNSLYETIQRNHAKWKSKGKTNLMGDGIHPELGDYGDNLIRMRGTVLQLRDLSMHMFVTSHSTVRKNPATDAEEIKPDLSGQLATSIPGMMSAVGYVYTPKGSGDCRTITFKQTHQIKAKDRSENGVLSASDFTWRKGENVLSEIFDRLGIE